MDKIRFNIDVSPAVRFAGEFVAIITGTPFTGQIERGVLAVAETVVHHGHNWKHYWESANGDAPSAWILMLSEKSVPLQLEYLELQSFIIAHEPFFFEENEKKKIPITRNIGVLWPHIQDGTLQAAWAASKRIDPWKVGEKMAELLKRSKIKPPAWGPTRRPE